MRWMLDNNFFITLYNHPLSSGFKEICHFFHDQFVWPKVNAKKKLPIRPLEFIFLLVRFRHFSIHQRHITSYSFYRSPCINSISSYFIDEYNIFLNIRNCLKTNNSTSQYLQSKPLPSGLIYLNQEYKVLQLHPIYVLFVFDNSLLKFLLFTFHLSLQLPQHCNLHLKLGTLQ